MSERLPTKRDIQQAITILRVEAVELEKVAAASLERAVAADQEVMGEYIRHATRLERQARGLTTVSRWLEELAGPDRRPASTQNLEVARRPT